MAVERLARTVRAAAAREPNIIRVILFGSLAQGVATPASDADLVVVTRAGEPRRMDRIPPLLELFPHSPLPLDLHPYTAEEWERAVATGEPVARLAAAEGIDLLDDDR